MASINNRSEIVFIYDVKDNNPNGDPLNENKPRIDEETSQNYVTDVRLKRTIRDFLAIRYKNESPNKIFMLAERNSDDKLKSITELTEAFANVKSLVESCIDIRLFGGTLAVKTEEGANAITGPVQFRLGRSMNRVVPVENKITRTVPNDKGKTQGTFGFDQLLHYSLIKFYGVINENTAKATNLSEVDVQKLIQGVWFGTKELNTRTKIGHTPRFLLKVDYKNGFFVGDLDSKIKLACDMPEEQIRTPDDYNLDTSKLNQILNLHKDKIENIYLLKDESINLTEDIKVEGKVIKDLSKESWFNIYQTV